MTSTTPTHSPSGHPANRLAGSSSPYLLQHAHNPVPWWPWCQEAIDEARRRDVPIFLSIGYSTCYWCHVMERESFEDASIGELLGREYVPIKLDREERPEIDEVYMAAVQMLTGRGGWPMSVFLEPQTLRPFWGGTYFPPRPAHGLPSFRQVLEGLAESYRTRRGDITKQAETISAAVREKLDEAGAAALVGRPQVSMAVQTLLTIFDRNAGGFGGAPKFPQPVYLEFLLDAREHLEDAAARDAIDLAIRTTLDAMALGGIHDHVGGGFHRYSVDSAWIVPHFEKMLYDQGQLLSVYARAAAVFSDPLYARTATRIADYVLAEMTSPEGGFYSAQDAEVDGREGLNYLWTGADLGAALPPEEARETAGFFGVASGPNFQDPHHPNEPPRNVLRLAEHPRAGASRLGVPIEQVFARLDTLATKLLAVRAKRKQPRLDDKVLTSWNGMMIAGLATAGRLLAQPRLVAAAARAADFLLSRLRGPDGGLLRCFREGKASVPGVLEDYAWLAQGLLGLAEADPASAAQRTAQAEQLVGAALAQFGDPDGRMFDARSSAELFVRPRSTYDGAVPSAGSVMLTNLVRLAERPGQEALTQAAGAALAAVSGAIAESPLAAINSTRALLRLITHDEPALVEALADAGASAGWQSASNAERELVQVLASADEIELAPDMPAEFQLRVQIAPGYHLAAAVPGESAEANALVPTRLSVIGGTGISVFAEMPKGEPLDAADPASPRVYHDQVDFPVVVELSGPWSGRPRLALWYQACSGRACLEPRALELAVEISRV